MKKYKNVQDLPLALSAEDVAEVLGISRAGAYTLLHSETVGFLVLAIGRRLVVPKDKLLAWIDAQIEQRGGEDK